MKTTFTNVKSFLFFLIITSLVSSLSAQNVGVNATGATPDVSAMLDIVNANKGLLIPRVALQSTTDAATIATPATSLLVYNNNASMTNGQGVGYYYNSGTTIAPLWIKLSSANEAWLLRGNTAINDPAVPATYGTSTIGTTENFLGTTDAQDVVFGTNNIERFRIKQNTGYVGLGTASPIVKMDIVAPDTMGLRILSGNTSRLTYLSLGRNIEYAQIGATTAGSFFTDAATGDMAIKNFNSGKLLLGASYFGTTDMSITPTYGNVGIKTVTPSSRLDVNGDLALREGPGIAVSTTYPIITLTAGAKYSHYRFTGATIPFWPYVINGGNDGQVITFINATGQPMNVYNYPAVNGIITGTGNHLTSTSTSNSSFTVMYNATLQRWIVTGYTGMTDNNDPDWHTTGNAAITTPAVPATYGTTAIATTENWAGTTDANDYVLGTNRIERFRVKQTTGFVGIGTAAPTTRLHITSPTAGATTTYSENSYVGNTSGIGMHGVSENAAGYGTGGLFEGGLYGVRGLATLNPATPAGSRYGGYFTGWYGSGTNYGSYNYGYGGANSYGVYAYAAGATNNIGGYFYGSGNYGVIVPNGGGLNGFGTPAPEQRLSVDQGANIDQDDANAGTTVNALTFGTGSGEGLGSKRTAGAGTNQFGLDFYQGFANRMRIWNDGRIAIGQTSAASLAPIADLTVWDPSTVSMTSDIPVFTAKHSGSSGTTWQMGSIEYYTEGEANIGFTYQICPLNSNTTTNLGGASSSKYLGFRWNQLYCSVAPNVSSDITLKKDIKSVQYGIHQLRNINPISYKYKIDYAGTDVQVPDSDKKTHIGFSAQELKQIVPELVSSWDYMTNNEDGYIKAKTPTLGVVYEEMIPITVNAIKELDKQQQAIIKTISISDFGMEQTKGNEIRVNYTKEFKDKLQGKPVVTITALEPNASYYISAIDNDGFIVKNNNITGSMSFNWMSMAKIKENTLEIPSTYTETEHAKKLKEIEAFEASLPTNEQAIKMIKAKAQAKEQNQKNILTPEQEKAKQDAEKLRTKTKELEKQFEAQHLKEEAERKAKELEEEKNNTKN